MFKALVPTLLVGFVLAGCGGGAQEAGPVPTAKGSTDSVPAATETTSGDTGSSTGSGSTSTSSTPRCSDDNTRISVAFSEGAAGTIETVWRARNVSSEACRSYGYPGMDFHSGSWLDVQVKRGGYPNINSSPSAIVVQPGDSLFFASYWGDVDTDAGPCKEFDRVKVTLPDNFSSAETATKGCVDTDNVRVGPVQVTQPG